MAIVRGECGIGVLPVVPGFTSNPVGVGMTGDIYNFGVEYDMLFDFPAVLCWANDAGPRNRRVHFWKRLQIPRSIQV